MRPLGRYTYYSENVAAPPKDEPKTESDTADEVEVDEPKPKAAASARGGR